MTQQVILKAQGESAHDREDNAQVEVAARVLRYRSGLSRAERPKAVQVSIAAFGPRRLTLSEAERWVVRALRTSWAAMEQEEARQDAGQGVLHGSDDAKAAEPGRTDGAG